MINCQLSPMKYADVQDIEKNIIPASKPNAKGESLKAGFKGSYVKIWLEPNQYASNGLAVRCEAFGKLIGYLPELKSVTEWKGEGHEWTKAVEAIGNQIKSEYDTNGFIGTKDEQYWKGNVAECRYKSTKDGLTRWKTYTELIDLSPEEQEDWHLDAVSVSFPVECL